MEFELIRAKPNFNVNHSSITYLLSLITNINNFKFYFICNLKNVCLMMKMFFLPQLMPIVLNFRGYQESRFHAPLFKMSPLFGDFQISISLNKKIILRTRKITIVFLKFIVFISWIRVRYVNVGFHGLGAEWCYLNPRRSGALVL